MNILKKLTDEEIQLSWESYQERCNVMPGIVMFDKAIYRELFIRAHDALKQKVLQDIKNANRS